MTDKPDKQRCRWCMFREHVSECHFNAPVVGTDGKGIWPRVNLIDWCGRFRWNREAMDASECPVTAMLALDKEGSWKV